MKTQILTWIASAWHFLVSNSRWMTWNLFLAIIPLALSVWLFRKSQSRSLLWWIGLLVFIAFLPNAPYILTDVIHLIEHIRLHWSEALITLVIIPIYLLFILSGFEAYVISVINLGYYLRKQGLSRLIIPAELFIHVLSAIGIYLGRFLRFNSWDIVTQPDSLVDSVLDDLTGKWPVLVIIVTFVVVAGLYALMKWLTLAVATYRPTRKSQPAAAQSPPNTFDRNTEF